MKPRNLKEKILKLRIKNKSYREIEKLLKCSRSTICYHLGEGQKEKKRNRTQEYKTKNSLINKVYLFKSRKLKDATRDFQRRKGYKLMNKSERYDFSPDDIINKFGVDTECYLSGEKINLLKDRDYSLDHIISLGRGGDNSIENLGILNKIVNKMKGNLTVDEFLYWCKKVLEHNNYEVKKRWDNPKDCWVAEAVLKTECLPKGGCGGSNPSLTAKQKKIK